jgi:hypothetical protein
MRSGDADLLTAQATRRLFEASGFEPLSTDYFLYLPESLFDKFGALENVLHKVPLGGQYGMLCQTPL